MSAPPGHLSPVLEPRGLLETTLSPHPRFAPVHCEHRPQAEYVVVTRARLIKVLSLQLFDLIYREETLFNVIKSVTRNGRSILLTALLALILVYLFSIVGFLFLKDDFILEVDRLPGNHSRGLGDFLSGVGAWGDSGQAQGTGVSIRQILERSSLHQPASLCMI